MVCSSGTGGSVGSTDHSGGSGAGGPVPGTRPTAQGNRTIGCDVGVSGAPVTPDPVTVRDQEVLLPPVGEQPPTGAGRTSTSTPRCSSGPPARDRKSTR